MKILTFLGPRPEIIRLSRVLALLEKHTQHILVHTGQNYDYQLNQIFFDDLGVKKPDYFMGVDTSSLGSVIGNVVIEAEKILRKEQPDAVLILGDTNSALAGIIAKRMKIPLFHMEAGNRSFDVNVPEEINRKIMDHISDINMVYTEHARRHLLAEGLHPRTIYLTGSPLYEVLSHYKNSITSSDVLSRLSLVRKKYFLVSFHREDNVDNKHNLTLILQMLRSLAERYNYSVIVSVHPRTRKRMDALGTVVSDPLIRFLEPFGFFDFVHLQHHAAVVLSDSGTLSEESAILGFPALTIRHAMERPEAMDTGSIILTGLDKDTVLDSVAYLLENPSVAHVPAEYQITNTSERALKIILGLTLLIPHWNGVVKNDIC